MTEKNRQQRRKIQRNPSKENYFLVDTCFWVNKYLKPGWVSDLQEKSNIELCHIWWEEINRQIKKGKAKIYVLDVCIAEAFKVLAKKNFIDKIFKYPVYYKNAREAIQKDIRLSPKDARKQKRKVVFHDIQTNRDIIITIDRFFEKLNKVNAKVGVIDLMVLSAGKCLMDFFGFSRENLFVVTADGNLYDLAKSLQDVPKVFNPYEEKDAAEKVFVG